MEKIKASVFKKQDMKSLPNRSWKLQRFTETPT